MVLTLTRILEIFERHDDPTLRQPKSQPRPLGYSPTHDRIVGMSTNSPLEEFMERRLRCKKEGYLEEPSINLQVTLQEQFVLLKERTYWKVNVKLTINNQLQGFQTNAPPLHPRPYYCANPTSSFSSVHTQPLISSRQLSSFMNICTVQQHMIEPVFAYHVFYVSGRKLMKRGLDISFLGCLGGRGIVERAECAFEGEESKYSSPRERDFKRFLP